MQLKFDTHMTRAILMLTSTSSKRNSPFSGGGETYAPPPRALSTALTAQPPYLAVMVLAVWVLAVTLRARHSLNK